MAGPGRYYALDEESAKKFGPTVEARDLADEKLLTIDADTEWRKLAKAAGWPYPNLSGLSEREITGFADAMSAEVQKRGFDGLDIVIGRKSDDDEAIRNVFSAAQVVFYEDVLPEETKPAAVEALDPPPVSKAASPLVAERPCESESKPEDKKPGALRWANAAAAESGPDAATASELDHMFGKDALEALDAPELTDPPEPESAPEPPAPATEVASQGEDKPSVIVPQPAQADAANDQSGSGDAGNGVVANSAPESGGAMEAGVAPEGSGSEGGNDPGGSEGEYLPDGTGGAASVSSDGPDAARPTADANPASVQSGLSPRSGVNQGNFQITDALGLGKGTDGQKIAGNLAAIRLAQKIKAENRFTTKAVQEVLARYVGWGGLKTVFDVKKANSTDQWGKAQRALRELLTPAEFPDAFQTASNAHYTSRPVVDAMWRAMRHFGFKPSRAPESDRRDVIQERIDALQQVLDEARRSGESKRTLSRIARRLQSCESKLDGLSTRKRDDPGFDFAEMGIGYLAVDEAHAFKNLEYNTARQHLVGMNNPIGSKRAFDLLVKVRGIQTRKPNPEICVMRWHRMRADASLMSAKNGWSASLRICVPSRIITVPERAKREMPAAKESRFLGRKPVASLTGKELDAWKDIRQLSKKAEAWYRENLIGKTVVNADTGMSIQFRREGARKVSGRRGDVLLRVVPALRQIIETGQRTSIESDNKGNAEVVAWHTISATVDLEGKPRDLVVKIKETREGKFHYHLSRDVTPMLLRTLARHQPCKQAFVTVLQSCRHFALRPTFMKSLSHNVTGREQMDEFL